jgi:anti-sigma B factor antagonist
MTVLKLCSRRPIIVRVEGPLRVPVSRALRREVRALLRRGERTIVVDLAEVSRIDAAGVGELIRAFNMTAAVDGALRIANASAWVRQILELTGLFDLLSGEEQSSIAAHGRESNGSSIPTRSGGLSPPVYEDPPTNRRTLEIFSTAP